MGFSKQVDKNVPPDQTPSNFQIVRPILAINSCYVMVRTLLLEL